MELNMAPVLDKIQDILPRIIKKKYRSKRQKKAGETIEEASGRVRPERVDKWSNPIIARLLLLLLLLILCLLSQACSSWQFF
jgi:hypothetical protein